MKGIAQSFGRVTAISIAAKMPGIQMQEPSTAVTGGLWAL